MIGIIVAMKKEAQLFIDKMENKKELSYLGKLCYTGSFNGKECFLIISGIGKVNSAICTQFLIDNCKPEYILNFGTTGGLDKNMKVGEIYIVKKAMQFDFDLREIDKCELGYMEEYDSVFFDVKNDLLSLKEAKGVLATSDTFSDDKNIINYLISKGCNLKDMEGGAICHTCKANNIPLIMIKGISDIFGSGSMIEQYLNNVKIASAKIIEFLE